MNERWRKLNANMHQYAPFRANMGQHCSLPAVQRKTAFLELPWWPEFDMFGSMPWCWFPWHKLLLPRLTPKNCYKAYSLSTDRWVYILALPKVIVAGLPRKAFTRKQACVDISVFLCLRKQQPRFAQGQPKGYFQTKELDRTTEALLEWMLSEKAQYAEFNVPTCGKIAVW